LKIVQYPEGSVVSQRRVPFVAQSVDTLHRSPMCEPHPPRRANENARGAKPTKSERTDGMSGADAILDGGVVQAKRRVFRFELRAPSIHARVHWLVAPIVARYSEALVPTEYGEVRLVVYRPKSSNDDESSAVHSLRIEEHMALVVGDLAASNEPVLARVHSECWTGEVLHSLKCDCREQLDASMRMIRDRGRGVVVYLRQEGRGIGLGNKIRAYSLQESGADTVEANRLLGFGDDERSYEVAGAILRDLGIASVELITNNPKKIAGVESSGVRVAKRVALELGPNPHNADYLEVKAKKMGHLL
jgi:GTP cyclohydrolase II